MLNVYTQTSISLQAVNDSYDFITMVVLYSKIGSHSLEMEIENHNRK